MTVSNDKIIKLIIIITKLIDDIQKLMKEEYINDPIKITFD